VRGGFGLGWGRGVAVFGVDVKGAAMIPCGSLAEAALPSSQARSIGERWRSGDGKG